MSNNLKKNLRPKKTITKTSRKPKSTSTWRLDWTEELTENLINFYRQNDCLWNIRSSDYKNSKNKKLCIEAWLKSRGLINSATQENTDSATEPGIMTELVPEVERKFKSLRTRFQSELKKIPKWRSGAGVDDINGDECAWVHFASLTFLKNVMVFGKTRSNLEVETSESLDQVEDADSEDGEDFGIRTQVDDLDETQDRNSTSTGESQETPVSTFTTEGIPNYSIKQSSIKKGANSSDAKLQCLEKCMAVLSEPNKQDAVDFFFKYCAETVKKMATEDQKECINKFQQVIMQFQST